MTDNDLNEQVEVTVDDATVITVPIDATLSNSNEAADAKAVGDALAQKADKSELQAAVKVNNQPADAQGLILIDGSDIPVSDEDTDTLAEAVTNLKGKTAEDIPMSSDAGAKMIAEVVNANSEAIENMEEMTGATMPMEPGSQTMVKAAIEARAKTVNRQAPDIDGNIDLSVVPLAENLQSDKMQSVDGSFIIRTTGGSSSVSDGKAYPQHILGTVEHDGYVAEVLNMTVIPVTRTEPDEPITATIDRDTFVAAVTESGTTNLYYTTEWSEDPEEYGVTVSGTPVAGDHIKIEYTKEARGTIKVADPDRLIGTGWNLFNYNQGYARVVKYSTEYGYKIGGTYTSLAFSATLTGERSSITPGADGIFNVASDGYVFVTGGNNTDTYILATWSDWMDGPASGYWEPYKESGVDLSYIMSTYFPYGLLAVGTTRDEIDLAAKRAISRIERKEYSEENRAAAAATGRGYSFDENNVYIVRESPVLNAITIEGEYTVSEHGLEWFTETVMPLITEILYGKNLRDKLERDVLTISPQNLAAEEQAQVRRNIGVMDPPLNGNGTAAQLLKTNGDGTTEWTTQGTPTDAQVGTAVSAWLTAHPEATTTVEDGVISRAKLNDDLKAKTDAVPDLKSAIINNDIVSALSFTKGYVKSSDGTITSSNSNYYSEMFPVEAGERYHLSGQVVSSIFAVAYYLSDDATNAESSSIPGKQFNEDIVIPKGIKYARICYQNTYGKLKLYKITTQEKLYNLKIFNVADYGATGSGNAETDTDAVQNALTDIQTNNGGILYFPQGSYYIDETINVPKYTCIKGVGSKSKIYWAGDSGEYMFDIQRGTGLKCEITDLWLDGGSNGNGIYDASENEEYSPGIRTKISNLWMDNFVVGIKVNGMGSEFSHITCNGLSDRSGIDNESSIGFDITGTDNFISDCRISLFGIGVHLRNNNNRLMMVKACVNETGIYCDKSAMNLGILDVQENYKDNIIIEECSASRYEIISSVAGADDEYLTGSDLLYSSLKIMNSKNISISGTISTRSKIGTGMKGNEKYSVYVDELSYFVTGNINVINNHGIDNMLLDTPEIYIRNEYSNRLIINRKEPPIYTKNPLTISLGTKPASLAKMTLSENVIRSTVEITTNIAGFILPDMENETVFTIISDHWYMDKPVLWYKDVASSAISQSSSIGYTYSTFVDESGKYGLQITFKGTAYLTEHIDEIEQEIGFTPDIANMRLYIYGKAMDETANPFTFTSDGDPLNISIGAKPESLSDMTISGNVITSTIHPTPNQNNIASFNLEDMQDETVFEVISDDWDIIKMSLWYKDTGSAEISQASAIGYDYYTFYDNDNVCHMFCKFYGKDYLTEHIDDITAEIGFTPDISTMRLHIYGYINNGLVSNFSFCSNDKYEGTHISSGMSYEEALIALDKAINALSGE